MYGLNMSVYCIPDSNLRPQSLTHAVYHLAASREILEELREEIEAILETDGWTKVAMGKMRKLDSFMRESQRVNGINSSACLMQMSPLL